MRGWWQELADLMLPVDCAGCGAPRAGLCPECAQALYGARARRALPSPAPAGLPPVYAAGPYADAIRAVLLAHKERGALRLAAPLGVALAGAVRAALPDTATGPPLLVPVPSARRTVAVRGHDPVRRIARAAAGELRRTGVPARVLPVLRQQRRVSDQSGLTARQRLRNLAGALAVPAGAERLLPGGPVVLVDDLMTTGASLVEGARALGVAGGRVIGAAVVAASLRAGSEALPEAGWN